MANTTINDLPLGEFTGQSQVPFNEGGIDKKALVGTAASKNTGTANDEIPTNADLGTAANLDAQTSATDTTAGRVTKTEGVNSARLRYFGTYYSAGLNVNIDDAVAGDHGLYTNNGLGTYPSGTAFFWVTTQSIYATPNPVVLVQEAVEYSSGAQPERSKFYRTKGSGDWSSWHKIYTSSNAVGTVSQSGGVPTGALVEYGSNANGEYWKYVGGMMVCQMTSVFGAIAIATANTDGTFRSGQIQVSMPVASATIVNRVSSAYVINNASGVTINGLVEQSNSVVDFALRSNTSNASFSGEVRITTIGRWF